MRVAQCCGLPFTIADADSIADSLIKAATSHHAMDVHLCNAYTISLIRRDCQLFDSLATASMNVADGTPLAWLLSRWGQHGPVRGPDLFRNLVSEGRDHNLRHYLWGGPDGAAARAQAALEGLFPGVMIVGAESPGFGDFDDAELAGLAARARVACCDVIWVALGTPKQDYVAHRLASLFEGPVVAIGAALNFVAGDVVEAPVMLRGTGLEWLFRLVQEPRRLWRRYLVNNCRFMLEVAFFLLKECGARAGLDCS